ncbi:MAG: glycosyltransferase [Candidatus Latescibacteria bacterium]|nr:glycosyltransferase [Candidatus Latescibacterota bacterium]
MIVPFVLVPLTLLYVCAVAAIRIGLGRLKEGENTRQYSVSVVVAARNEEGNIGQCLERLVSQDYPSDRVEVVVVDDRSTDGTGEIVKDFGRRYEHVRLVRVDDVPSGLSAKKYALSQGISASKGEILFVTDADCLPGKGWLSGMMRYFEPDVGMVAGYSPFQVGEGLFGGAVGVLEQVVATGGNEGTSEVAFSGGAGSSGGSRLSMQPRSGMRSQRSGRRSFERLLAFEAMVTATMAAGSIGIGGGVTCAARNLAYRREVFEQVGGFSKIEEARSGDDTLLLQLVGKATNWKVRYAISPGTFVQTFPPDGFGAFFDQRTRHLSTVRIFTKPLLALAGAVYLFDLLLIVSVPWALITGTMGPLLCFGAKVVADWMAMWRSSKLFGGRRLLGWFPIMELLYPPYMVLFGALGAFKNFRWKE